MYLLVRFGLLRMLNWLSLLWSSLINWSTWKNSQLRNNKMNESMNQWMVVMYQIWCLLYYLLLHFGILPSTHRATTSFLHCSRSCATVASCSIIFFSSLPRGHASFRSSSSILLFQVPLGLPLFRFLSIQSMACFGRQLSLFLRICHIHLHFLFLACLTNDCSSSTNSNFQ